MADKFFRLMPEWMLRQEDFGTSDYRFIHCLPTDRRWRWSCFQGTWTSQKFRQRSSMDRSCSTRRQICYWSQLKKTRAIRIPMQEVIRAFTQYNGWLPSLLIGERKNLALVAPLELQDCSRQKDFAYYFLYSIHKCERHLHFWSSLRLPESDW